MFILAQRGDPIPLWFPVVFIGGWFAVSYMVAQSGWVAFARRHGHGVRPRGPSFGSPVTNFNESWLGNYRNVVRVIPTDEGLWFYNMILFRAFHPSFLVPWSSVTRVEALSMWQMRGYLVHIRSEAGSIEVRLRRGFREVLLKHRPDLLTIALTEAA